MQLRHFPRHRPRLAQHSRLPRLLAVILSPLRSAAAALAASPSLHSAPPLASAGPLADKACTAPTAEPRAAPPQGRRYADGELLVVGHVPCREQPCQPVTSQHARRRPPAGAVTGQREHRRATAECREDVGGGGVQRARVEHHVRDRRNCRRI